MNRMTFDDLKVILIESAGEDEETSLDGDVLDVPFTDLGYDSLALLETAAIVSRRYGATVPDDDVTAAQTPRQLLDAVNDAMSNAA